MKPLNAQASGSTRVRIIACALGGLFALLGYNECAGKSQPAGATGSERAVHHDIAPSPHPHDSDAIKNSPTLLDVESLRASQVLLYGEIDTVNRYSSTVLVKPREESTSKSSDRTECSGVLIAPRLILTAGHCMCKPHGKDVSSGGDNTTADASECAKEAVVTTFIHTPSKEIADESIMTMGIYKGEVRPHPSMKIRHSTTKGLVSSITNLAVILLEEPSAGEIQPVPLSNAEIQDGEAITVVGYGYDELIGGKHGTRRSTTMTVEKAAGTPTWNIKFDQPSMRLYPNDSGGPCFVENTKGPSLIGVVGTISGEKSSLTSIYDSRDWLRAEILHAAN